MGTLHRVFGFDFDFGLGLGLGLGLQRGLGHGQFAPCRRCNCCIAIIICPESSRVGLRIDQQHVVAATWQLRLGSRWRKNKVSWQPPRPSWG